MKTRRVWIAVVLLVAIASFSIAGWGRVGAEDGAAGDLARGRHIATALAGCADCHGAQFAGGRTFTRGGVTVVSANLTSGAGGIAAQSDAELRRAIRTGVAPDGTRLRVMPTREYAVFTDRDVNDVIAFLRSLPAVDRVAVNPPALPAPSAAPMDVSPATGASPATVSDSRPSEPARPALSTGAYLATIGGCTNCHGANLAGGVGPGGVATPNISRTGIGAWSFTEFQTAMRTGKTPAGRELAPVMPWRTFAGMTDAELRSIYDYLEMQTARTARSSRDMAIAPRVTRLVP